MPEGEQTTQQQLETKLNEAKACIENAKDTLKRLVFSRENFDGFIEDAETKLAELDNIE